MMMWWWWIWMVLMLFLLLPVGYGWGYRGWGPPYPRYLQRRRGERAAAAAVPSTFDHHSWGWGGDIIWMVLSIWILAAVISSWW